MVTDKKFRAKYKNSFRQYIDSEIKDFRFI